MNKKENNQSITPKEKGNKTIFGSAFIEAFTKTPPFVAILLFISIGVALGVYAFLSNSLSLLQLLILFPIGVFSFSLIEYLIHRFVFHMELSTKNWIKIQYAIHGVHHEYPNDKKRLVMPPLLSLTLATLLFMIPYYTIGNYAFAIMGGFYTGYALYLFVHYIVHAWKMPKNKLKTLWLLHNIHHFQDDKVAFGVSSPLWDKVFGTLPKYSTGKIKK